MEGGLEGAWRGQRDRGRGAYPKGGREGKTNSASEEESVAQNKILSFGAQRFLNGNLCTRVKIRLQPRNVAASSNRQRA